MSSRPWEELLRDPASERHVVQVYRDPSFLVRAVAAWALPPLSGEGGVVLVCTPRHAALVEERLRADGLDAAALRASGRLAVVDAEETLSSFMRDGAPDRAAFLQVASRLAGGVRAACGEGAEVRAWGEMVDLLAKRGQPEAAQRLESLWNEAIDAEGIRLLCSYEMDNLDPETHAGRLARACAGHSQLIPEEDPAAFDLAMSRALADVFGEEEAGLVRALLAKRRTLPIAMPAAEAVLVALHDAQPAVGRRLLQATRLHLAKGA